MISDYIKPLAERRSSRFISPPSEKVATPICSGADFLKLQEIGLPFPPKEHIRTIISILNTKGREEALGYSNYVSAKKEYQKIADDFQAALSNDTQNSYSFKGMVCDFLSEAEKNNINGAKQFIKNLTRLAELEIPSTHKVFKNAYKTMNEHKEENNLHEETGRISVSGFFLEPVAAISLIERGFTIEEMSSEYQVFRHSQRIRREIDLIASKEIEGERVRFYIDVKTNTSQTNLGSHKRGQIDDLVDKSLSEDSIPVVMVMHPPTALEGGEVLFDEYSKNGLKNNSVVSHLRRNNALMVWDKNANNISECFLFGNNSAIHPIQ